MISLHYGMVDCTRKMIIITTGVSANTKHLYNICTTAAQRLRRWLNIVQMFYTNVLCLLGVIYTNTTYPADTRRWTNPDV